MDIQEAKKNLLTCLLTASIIGNKTVLYHSLKLIKQKMNGKSFARFAFLFVRFACKKISP